MAVPEPSTSDPQPGENSVPPLDYRAPRDDKSSLISERNAGALAMVMVVFGLVVALSMSLLGIPMAIIGFGIFLSAHSNSPHRWALFQGALLGFAIAVLIVAMSFVAIVCAW